MERVSELTSATISVLARNYILLIALVGLVLAFAVYIYMTPKVMEFFTGASIKGKSTPQPQPLERVRAEPPEEPRQPIPEASQ
jgi:hypothetical protein